MLYFATLETVEGEVVNVKDYGAIGDGETDDKTAIVNAFNYAIQNLPATVYFPEGEYGILNGGIYIDIPLGSSGLSIMGDGAEKSVIKYLDEWDNAGSWVALRLQPESTPTTEEEYLKNIVIKNLGVYDTDPLNHNWSTDKGDPDTEETHGFNIKYCINAVIENCKVDNVGDEAIDLGNCINSTIKNNIVCNSPAAGGTIDGLTITIDEYMGTTPGIYLSNSNCTVKNCTITVPTNQYAISEYSTGVDYNTVTNNVIIGGIINKAGINSVFSNNELRES